MREHHQVAISFETGEIEIGVESEGMSVGDQICPSNFELWSNMSKAGHWGC